MMPELPAYQRRERITTLRQQIATLRWEIDRDQPQIDRDTAAKEAARNQALRRTYARTRSPTDAMHLGWATQLWQKQNRRREQLQRALEELRELEALESRAD